jgi:hypothetical protein
MTERKEVWFGVGKDGRARAYEWSRQQFRSFQVPVGDALEQVARGDAVVLAQGPPAVWRRSERE